MPCVAVGDVDGAREWGGGRCLAGCLEDVQGTSKPVKGDGNTDR